MPDMPIEGGCRCGKVRFRINQSPLFTAICHCTGCQKMTGSAFSTTVCVPADGFDVIEGETVAGGMHGGREKGDHQHCDWCKSWIFTRVPAAMGVINVRATMLDDASWVTPFLETYTSEALPWAIQDSPRSYAKFPPPEEYQAIVADYAKVDS